MPHKDDLVVTQEEMMWLEDALEKKDERIQELEQAIEEYLEDAETPWWHFAGVLDKGK